MAKSPFDWASEFAESQLGMAKAARAEAGDYRKAILDAGLTEQRDARQQGYRQDNARLESDLAFGRARDIMPFENAQRRYNTDLETESYEDRLRLRGELVSPSGHSGMLNEAIAAKAAEYGEDPILMESIAGIESGGKLTAQNPHSSAGGPFQFLDGTAKAYGLRNKSDPLQASDAAARYIKDVRASLTRVLGRDPTPGEMYLGYQQGPGGGAKLLANPDADAASIVGRDAVVKNGGRLGMSARQFADLWVTKGDARYNSTASRRQTAPGKVGKQMMGTGGLSPEATDYFVKMGVTPIREVRMSAGQIELLPPEMKKQFIPNPFGRADRYGNVPYVMVDGGPQVAGSQALDLENLDVQ